MKQTTVGAVIQARMGSSRLPGKVLKPLSGKPVLEWIIAHLRQSRRLDRIVVATTGEAQDSPIAALCERLDVSCYRGSELDVLDRYYQAARLHGLTHVLRITADCPFTDPLLVDEVIDAFLDAAQPPDFAANNFNRRYPRGTDVAMMSFEALERAWREAARDYERVHVTPYIREHPDKFRLLSIEGEQDYGHYRWTVDTPEDLALSEQIFDRLDHSLGYSWQAVLKILHKEPELALINSHVRQKELHEL
jgi:spore coat polysaccharide biosynthesis protein SpsF